MACYFGSIYTHLTFTTTLAKKSGEPTARAYLEIIRFLSLSAWGVPNLTLPLRLTSIWNESHSRSESLNQPYKLVITKICSYSARISSFTGHKIHFIYIIAICSLEIKIDGVATSGKESILSTGLIG